MWRSETDSSNLFQLFSTEHGVFYSSSLAVQQAFSSPSPRLQIRHALSAFTWVLRTQTQVLMLGQPAFYLQSPLSSSWNNFNTMFSICIYLVWVYSQFSLERLKTHFGGRCWLGWNINSFLSFLPTCPNLPCRFEASWPLWSHDAPPPHFASKSRGGMFRGL